MAHAATAIALCGLSLRQKAGQIACFPMDIRLRKEPASDRTIALWLRRFALISVGLLLSGCSEFLVREDPSSPSAGADVEVSAVPESDVGAVKALSPHGLIEFLTNAAEGESTLISESGRTVDVTAGRYYSAASGRTCRYFAVRDPSNTENSARRIACNGDDGDWYSLEAFDGRL
jgi:hypothetical protein